MGSEAKIRMKYGSSLNTFAKKHFGIILRPSFFIPLLVL